MTRQNTIISRGALRSATTTTTRWFSSSDDDDDDKTTKLAAPILHHCEIVFLGEGVHVGRVEEILTPQGSTVQAGDLMAFLTTTVGPNGERVRHEFPAPLSGIVQDILVTVGEEIKVGQDFCLIQRQQPNNNNNTDKATTPEPPHHAAARNLIQHIRDNGGEITNEYLQKHILNSEDTTMLLHVAHLIREFQIPHLRPKSLTLLERVLTLQQRESDPAALAQTYTEMAILHHELGDLDMAELSVRQSLELRKTQLGEDHPETAASYIHLGMMLQQAGKFPEAIDTIQIALTMQRTHAGETHVMVAGTYNTLGALYYRTAQFPAAVEHYTKALEIYQSAHDGEPHKDTAGTYMNLAMALKFLQTKESMEQAVEYAKLSLKLRLELLGPKHADTAASHYNLGHLLSECDQYADALEQFRAAIVIQQELYGATSPIVAVAYNNIGAVRFNMQEFQGALEEYDRAMDILKQSQAENPRFKDEMAATLNNRGMALLFQQDAHAALECHKEAQQLLESAAVVNKTQLAVTLRRMAHVHKQMLQLKETLDLFRQAHALLEETFGKNHTETASSHNVIGVTLSAMARYEEASAEYQLARQSFAAALGKDHPEVAACHFNLGLTMVHQYEGEEKKRLWENDGKDVGGDDDEDSKALLAVASKEFQAAQTIWMKTLGMNHPRTKNAMINAQDPLLALRPGTIAP